MKWFKHVSDSLDDPFIVELLDEFGSDAYLVFFGIIEIYSREFSPENGWKLDVTLPFFHRKLHTSPLKIKKILSKIYKWEISYYDNRVMIFIPKFKELLDNWTVRQLPKEEKELRSNDVETTQPIRIKNKDKRIKKENKNILTPIIPYEGIIEYLNQKTGKNFDHTVKEIRLKIKARSRNGKRTIEDFKKVIDNKCNQWFNDEKMMQFLRPETLFGTKFESYLNETIHPLAGKFSDKTLANIKMFENWRPPDER